MAEKYKIAVLGAGGLGGFVAGKLANAYSNSDDVEITLITRGENESVIRRDGLKLLTGNEELVVHPSIGSPELSEIPPQDLIICCVKGYDLDDAIRSIKGCLGSETIILSLLNGVDVAERISALVPDVSVLEGCVYVISTQIAAGVIKQTGSINQLHFGSATIDRQVLSGIDTIFKQAGINSIISDNIRLTVWEKFLFISTVAAVTTYTNRVIGNVVLDRDAMDLLVGLMKELIDVARTQNISLPEDSIERAVNKLKAMPSEGTSSMHTDFKKGKRTEVDSLIGYVVRAGRQAQFPLPLYNRIFNSLKER